MSSPKLLLLPALALTPLRRWKFAVAGDKKQPPPPPAHAKSPSPLVTDELIHKQFGDNCSLLPGPPQFVADMDDGGIEMVVAAQAKNPMAATKDEYSFVVADPYDSFLGYSDIKVTSTFASTFDPTLARHQPADHSRRGKSPGRRKSPGQVLLVKFALQDADRETAGPEKKKKTILGIYTWKKKAKAKTHRPSSTGMERNTATRRSGQRSNRAKVFLF